MRAYESGTFSDRAAASTRQAVGITDGPYRLRGASDTAWPAQGYGNREGISRRLVEALNAALKIILPVLFLCISLAAIYLYMDRALPYFADRSGSWLTISHLILPAAFFTIHLTNRRYGPNYAFAQIVISFAVAAAVVAFGPDVVRQLLPSPVTPSVREVAMFVVAFFAAGFLSIVAFDGARGPRWWTAPLAGSIVASLTYALIFYPAAFAGTHHLWGSHMAIHAAILIGASILALAPYWLLRRTVQPMSGFGGY